jgi:glycosyltransferase involved in cell wall biosynthesis
MRVLHINNERTWRGGERQTLLTALEQRRQGVDARLACRRGSPLEGAAQAEGLPVLALSTSVPAVLLTLARAARSFDVLHCHTGRAHSLGLLATLPGRKPMVVSRRTDFPPPRSWFNRWKYGRAEQVVCVCQQVAKVLRAWGLPPAKISVIYEAVPGHAYLPREECRKQLRQRGGVPADKKIVGNIAALVPDKDQATLLRAAQAVTAQRPDAVFVLVGDGELKGQLTRLRDQLGLASKVYFTGFVQEAQRLMPGFDLFAVSSSHEGFCTVILDAALADVPVAATAGGGIPENVLHEQTGLLVPVGDAAALGRALLRLLEEPDLGARLARAAKERIQRDFSVASMARKYVEVYESILGARGSAPGAKARPLEGTRRNL